MGEKVSVVTGSVTSMPSELVLDRPPVSVTRTDTVAVPGRRSVNFGLALVESSNAPSLSRSHAYENASRASGSVDFVPSRRTVSGAGPETLSAVTTAVGAWLAGLPT